MNRTATTLTLHGSIILFLCFIAGGFYGAAIVLGGDAESVRAWRVAHMEGLTNALIILGAIAVLPHISLSRRAMRVLMFALLIGGYCNTFGSSLAAITGTRGLDPAIGGWNLVALGIYGLGGPMPFIVAGLLGWGALSRLREGDADDGAAQARSPG